MYQETKPAWKTTEFWITVVVNLAAILQYSIGVVKLSEKTTAILQAAVSGLYILSRGLAKNGVPFDPLSQGLTKAQRDGEALDKAHLADVGAGDGPSTTSAPPAPAA